MRECQRGEIRPRTGRKEEGRSDGGRERKVKGRRFATTEGASFVGERALLCDTVVVHLPNKNRY